MIDRRTFLRRLGFGTISAAAAALTFDVEKLLWVPGEKTILLPSPAAVQMFHAETRLAFAVEFDGTTGRWSAPNWANGADQSALQARVEKLMEEARRVGGTFSTEPGCGMLAMDP